MSPGNGSETALLTNTSTLLERPDPFPANMTAFLKIDDCNDCHRSLPWEWIPAVLLNGKPLAGTGVWRSSLTDSRCPACMEELENERREAQLALHQRGEVVALLGGEKPYREFTFERYRVTPGNRLAYEGARAFNPAADSLYLWGACGTGKTHLAYAIARRAFEESLSVRIVRPGQLVRKARMKEPEQEQAVIDQLVRADVFTLDDLGSGTDSAYGRQLLQEILDARDFLDKAGLVVTSTYALDALAQRLNDDAIPSRLAGMCRVIEVRGPDGRFGKHGACESSHA